MLDMLMFWNVVTIIGKLSTHIFPECWNYRIHHHALLMMAVCKLKFITFSNYIHGPNVQKRSKAIM